MPKPDLVVTIKRSDELRALEHLVSVLEALEPDERVRAAQYLNDRYGEPSRLKERIES